MKYASFLLLIPVLLSLTACSLLDLVTSGEGETALEEPPTTIPTVTPLPPTPEPTLPPPTATTLPPPTEIGAEEPAPPAEEGEPSPEAPPARSASPDPPTYGELVFTTDFSTGWPDQEYEGFGTLLSKPGGYELHVTYQGLWTTTTRVSQSEFYAEAETTASQCPVGQAFYGLVFAYRDNEHLRTFVVTCSGRYAFFERESSNRAQTLAQGELPSGLDPSVGLHRIGVLSKENVVTFYFDDVPLANAGVLEMPTGDVGPYAETTGAPLTVLFSQLSVYQAR